jgi:hypothetical protein
MIDVLSLYAIAVGAAWIGCCLWRDLSIAQPVMRVAERATAVVWAVYSVWALAQAAVIFYHPYGAEAWYGSSSSSNALAALACVATGLILQARHKRTGDSMDRVVRAAAGPDAVVRPFPTFSQYGPSRATASVK